MRSNIILVFIALFFLFAGSWAIILAIVKGIPQRVIWLCYLTLVLSGIAILAKKPSFLAAQISILFIPMLFWIIDFFYTFLLQKSFLGITLYFFAETSFTQNLISSLHLYTVPLQLIALSFMKLPDGYFWKISFLELGAVFILGRLFTTSEFNINCIYSSCIPVILPGPYIFWWFVIMFALVIIASFLLIKIPALRAYK